MGLLGAFFVVLPYAASIWDYCGTLVKTITWLSCMYRTLVEIDFLTIQGPRIIGYDECGGTSMLSSMTVKMRGLSCKDLLSYRALYQVCASGKAKTWDFRCSDKAVDFHPSNASFSLISQMAFKVPGILLFTKPFVALQTQR